MAVFEEVVYINRDIETVYRISQDYSVRYQWDPFPERIALLGGETEIVAGVRALVVAKSGLKMEVEFVNVVPPTSAAIVMTKGPAILSKFGGSWIFRAEDNASTQARFRYLVKVKWWALPWISERIAAWYFRREVIKRLSGLKRYCESEA
ncbi:SRPBCC family protein [Pseudoduganella sp. OTU4001]|uniref:SRPBCC family protein n=1 Tax=Pseudoduganella sp. OTU4001 TaxID=3043854 RepID=UPI00313AB365